jgi:hypothetical protein
VYDPRQAAGSRRPRGVGPSSLLLYDRIALSSPALPSSLRLPALRSPRFDAMQNARQCTEMYHPGDISGIAAAPLPLLCDPVRGQNATGTTRTIRETRPTRIQRARYCFQLAFGIFDRLYGQQLSGIKSARQRLVIKTSLSMKKTQAVPTAFEELFMPLRLLAALPFIGILLGVPFVNRVEPLVLGMPFVLAWIVLWVVLGAVIMAVIYAFDPANREPVDESTEVHS